jgi:hypothetical protein
MQAAAQLCEGDRIQDGLLPVMNEIAHQAAREAASQAIELHKRDMELRFRDLKEEIVDKVIEEVNKSNKAYYGDIEPYEHYMSHVRVDRLLNFLDDFQSSILRKAITMGLLILMGGGIVMLLFWDRIKDALPGIAAVGG